MDWRDVGILLTVRRHGETSAIVEALTRDHGRHAGVVRGGTSRKLTPILQPGAELDLTWRARLSEHIGSFTVEPLRTRAGAAMGDRTALAGLNAVTSLLSLLLPEREPHPGLFTSTQAVLDVLGEDGWPVAYLQWEVGVLDDLGYALELENCAVTGRQDDLAYVSPKSGRAVSRDGAKGYEDRLLPLPDILINPRTGDPKGTVSGLETTGYFLANVAAALGNKPLPGARQRLLDLLVRTART